MALFSRHSIGDFFSCILMRLWLQSDQLNIRHFRHLDGLQIFYSDTIFLFFIPLFSIWEPLSVHDANFKSFFSHFRSEQSDLMLLRWGCECKQGTSNWIAGFFSVMLWIRSFVSATKNTQQKKLTLIFENKIVMRYFIYREVFSHLDFSIKSCS